MYLSETRPQNTGTHMFTASLFTTASLVAQLVKNAPAMRETWVQCLGWEDLLEEDVATHSSTLAWRIPWTEEPWGCNPWDHRESDTTERLTLTLKSFVCSVLS